MTSQPHHTKPATPETLAAEHARLRKRVDIACEWLRELLAMPTSRPSSRLAMHVDGLQDELQGVLDYVCNEGGVYPYRFDPYLAHPRWCTALMIDDFDDDGFARYGQGLVIRFPEFAPADLERGDVVQVRGHFDDPLAASCSAETEPGFGGPAVDVPFLVLFCREQFVPQEWQVVDHRDLAPLPWEP